MNIEEHCFVDIDYGKLRMCKEINYYTQYDGYIILMASDKYYLEPEIINGKVMMNWHYIISINDCLN